MTKVKPLDTLLAIKALCLHEDLLNSDRIIGAILIEHFNRKTGQCDPGVKRMSELAGLDEQTVMRAIGRLVRSGLFSKRRHGGYSNRNSYEPNWELFSELDQRWRLKFGKARIARESVSTKPGRDVGGRSGVTQTYSLNPLKQTLAKGSARKERKPSCSQPSDQASRAAAHRRWDKDLLDHFRGRPKEYSRAVEVIDRTISDSATSAELELRGAGLEVILRAIAPKKPEEDDREPGYRPTGGRSLAPLGATTAPGLTHKKFF